MKQPTGYLKLGLSKLLTCGPYPAHQLLLYGHKQRMAFTDVHWQSFNEMIGNINFEPELRISVFSLVDILQKKLYSIIIFLNYYFDFYH